MKLNQDISRRDFLKLSGIVAGAAMLPRFESARKTLNMSYPIGKKLGRVCAGEYRSWIDLRTEPNMDAPLTTRVWRDDVFEIKQEVIANKLDFNRYNQRWYETADGFIYAPFVQPVKNIINTPLSALPLDQDGKPGLWVEITQPVVNMELTKSPTNASSWIRDSQGLAKLYYSQVYWASDIRQANGRTEYLLSEKYGALPDYYWVDAAACRPITHEEVSPIRPEVGDKRILVNLQTQTLSCFEGSHEVYFCDVSTGYIKEGKWLTPPETTPVWRKMISLHMSAGGFRSMIRRELAGLLCTTLMVRRSTPFIGTTILVSRFHTAVLIACPMTRSGFGAGRTLWCRITRVS